MPIAWPGSALCSYLARRRRRVRAEAVDPRGATSGSGVPDGTSQFLIVRDCDHLTRVTKLLERPAPGAPWTVTHEWAFQVHRVTR